MCRIVMAEVLNGKNLKFYLKFITLLEYKKGIYLNARKSSIFQLPQMNCKNHIGNPLNNRKNRGKFVTQIGYNSFTL